MQTISQLESSLKQGVLSGMYLLYGKETFLLESCFKKIKKLFGNLAFGLNYIKIDDQNIDSLITEMQTPSFGFDKKLIVVNEACIIKKMTKRGNQQAEEKSKAVAKFIEDNFEDIIDQNVVVFIAEEIEKNDIFKVIDKNGVVCNFEEQKPIELFKRLEYIFKAYNIKIDNYTLNYFVENYGSSMQDLINESKKLVDYAGPGGQINTEIIEKLCIRQFESVIFDLTDSIGQKNTARALDVLRGLIYSKEPIQKIFVTLYNHIKKIYIVKMCERDHRDIVEPLKLKANQTFLVNKYKRQAGYFSEEELKNILLQFISLDENYKSGNYDLNISLEGIICAYCSK